jgi:hypothetical protein
MTTEGYETRQTPEIIGNSVVDPRLHSSAPDVASPVREEPGA